ncbi:cytochrome P450 [Thermothelomyces heterothallicus CBS 202.75]|uniref:cytochrome P450 n=1 Tax=Thermothelomyces heterothallicus CBS 202.75 TaxID=1149848 RepID=UPI00374386F0
MAVFAGLLTWSNAIGAITLYFGTLVFYRLFLHPLARFPGPKLAAISRWYEGYYDFYLGGQYTLKIRDLHRQYAGPIIRISPHELHVSDSAFYEKLYRMDGRWDKYAWTYDAFGATFSTIFGSDHVKHRARRAAIAPLFSKARIAARQDVIRKNVVKFCGRIAGFAGTTFNLGAAVSAFTRDTANEFVVGKGYDELDMDDFNVGLSTPVLGAGTVWRTTKFIRWYGPLLKAIPSRWILKWTSEGTKSYIRYLKKCFQHTDETLAAVKSSSPDANVENSVVHAIVRSGLPAAEKSELRIRQEVSTVTTAGFETTASALRLLLCHVFTDDTVRGRLRAELASAGVGAGDGRLELKTLERLPYLTAVLMEGLRLSPGIGTRSARISDKDLFYGDDWRIPAGTPVGMTVLLMHTDEDNFADPRSFDPDRWMDPATRRAAEKTFAPFSRGTRVCLGMHLAWAELYMLLAALVQRFDFTFEGATPADFEFAFDSFAIGTKAGCNLFATPYLRQV